VPLECALLRRRVKVLEFQTCQPESATSVPFAFAVWELPHAMFVADATKFQSD
jgi:hypothetical protein